MAVTTIGLRPVDSAWRVMLLLTILVTLEEGAQQRLHQYSIHSV